MGRSRSRQVSEPPSPLCSAGIAEHGNYLQCDQEGSRQRDEDAAPTSPQRTAGASTGVRSGPVSHPLTRIRPICNSRLRWLVRPRGPFANRDGRRPTKHDLTSDEWSPQPSRSACLSSGSRVCCFPPLQRSSNATVSIQAPRAEGDNGIVTTRRFTELMAGHHLRLLRQWTE
jgi:hypothetical protein